jgi:hypothetical protein
MPTAVVDGPPDSLNRRRQNWIWRTLSVNWLTESVDFPCTGLTILLTNLDRGSVTAARSTEKVVDLLINEVV